MEEVIMREISFGVDAVKNLYESGIPIGTYGTVGWTPLHIAANIGGIETIEYLISKGVDVNAKTNEGMTPLHYSVLGNKIGNVKFLLNKGSDRSIKNNDGENALDLAIRKGDCDYTIYSTLGIKEPDYNDIITVLKEWYPVLYDEPGCK